VFEIRRLRYLAGISAAQVLDLMQKKSITSVFVVDAQLRPLGLVRIHGCLRAGLE
jgi:hypothetical protein